MNDLIVPIKLIKIICHRQNFLSSKCIIIEFYYRISLLGPDNAKTKDHTLETVGIWIMQYIQATSTSLKKEMYELLPFLCQFVGNETGQQEVSQTCLKSLCYLSVCITPPNAIPFALEMIWKVAQSESWKAKMSSLEFAQTFVFTNFMSLCLHEDYVNQIGKKLCLKKQDQFLFSFHSPMLKS